MHTLPEDSLEIPVSSTSWKRSLRDERRSDELMELVMEDQDIEDQRQQEFEEDRKVRERAGLPKLEDPDHDTDSNDW